MGEVITNWIGCPSYHLMPWKRSGLIQKTLAQIPKAFPSACDSLKGKNDLGINALL